MLNLAGGTVQCLNPECIARGRWLRLHDAPQECCNNCGAPLIACRRRCRRGFDARAANEELPADGTRALKSLRGCAAG